MANSGKLVNENDCEFKCDYDPTGTMLLNFASEITYKQIFFETRKFINENNRKNKTYLEYPKLYIKSKNPKCQDKINCQQCKNNNSCSSEQITFSICATKRREIGNNLFDIGEKRHCITDSLATTAGKLCIQDKMLIYESNRYNLKPHSFANVYSFLQWQQEAVHGLLQNLVSLNANGVEQDVFLHKFDVLALLHSYLDELIEYLLLLYCCFDSKSWIAVFYPFIEVALGTRCCKRIFASVESNRQSKQASVKSICAEALNQLNMNGTGLVSMAQQMETKERCVQEMKGITIFKRLLCDVYNYYPLEKDNYNEIANNANYSPFDLVHLINIKLKETVGNIKTQLVIHEMTGDNIYESISNKDESDKPEPSTSNDVNKELKVNVKNVQEKGIDKVRNGVTMKVPRFIRLFVIKRVIDKYIGTTSGDEKKEKMIKKITNVYLKNTRYHNQQIETKAVNILLRLMNNGLKKYMKKTRYWYFEIDLIKKDNIIEIIFQDIILTAFIPEYTKVTTYIGSKPNRNESTTVEYYQNTVFNSIDLMCCIFQYLKWYVDLFKCSLVNSHWLYYSSNRNSIFYADLSLPLHLITQHLDRYYRYTLAWKCEQISQAKYINIYSPISYNHDTSRNKFVLNKIASSLTHLQRLSITFYRTCDSNVLLFWQLLKPIIDKNNTEIQLNPIQLPVEHMNTKLHSLGLLNKFKKITELRFPLSNKQSDLLSNAKNWDLLVNDMTHFGTINLDVHHLILKIQNEDKPSIYAIHKLEKRLGILLQDEEICDAMNEMNCDLQEIFNDDKRQEFLNKMMEAVTYGVSVTKHCKRSQPSHRWILISNDRFFWKESLQHKNDKSRSLHFTKIIQIMQGKNTRALKECETAKKECCFSVISGKVTMDVEIKNEDLCNKWIRYLKILHRHFRDQANELEKYSQTQRRFSAIGIGFDLTVNNNHKNDKK